jgi:hypothetical protein
MKYITGILISIKGLLAESTTSCTDADLYQIYFEPSYGGNVLSEACLSTAAVMQLTPAIVDVCYQQYDNIKLSESCTSCTAEYYNKSLECTSTTCVEKGPSSTECSACTAELQAYYESGACMYGREYLTRSTGEEFLVQSNSTGFVRVTPILPTQPTTPLSEMCTSSDKISFYGMSYSNFTYFSDCMSYNIATKDLTDPIVQTCFSKYNISQPTSTCITCLAYHTNYIANCYALCANEKEPGVTDQCKQCFSFAGTWTWGRCIGEPLVNDNPSKSSTSLWTISLVTIAWCISILT